jgi:hypothetical protein
MKHTTITAAVLFAALVVAGPASASITCTRPISTPRGNYPGVGGVTETGTTCSQAYEVARAVQRLGVRAYSAKVVQQDGTWRLSQKGVFVRKLNPYDPIDRVTCRKAHSVVTFYMGS